MREEEQEVVAKVLSVIQMSFLEALPLFSEFFSEETIKGMMQAFSAMTKEIVDLRCSGCARRGSCPTWKLLGKVTVFDVKAEAAKQKRKVDVFWDQEE